MTLVLFNTYSGLRTDDHRPHRSQQQMDSANASSPGPAEAAPSPDRGGAAGKLDMVAGLSDRDGLMVLFGARGNDSKADEPSGARTPKPSANPSSGPSTVVASVPKPTTQAPTDPPAQPTSEPTTAPSATGTTQPPEPAKATTAQ